MAEIVRLTTSYSLGRIIIGCRTPRYVESYVRIAAVDDGLYYTAQAIFYGPVHL